MSLEELKCELQYLAEAYGFKGYQFLDIGNMTSQSSCEQIMSYPTLEDDYRVRHDNNIDPCLAKARRTSIPFTTMSDKSAENSHRNKPGELKLVECAQKQVSKSGLVVPYHFVDPAGRTYSGLILFLWKNKIADFRTILKVRQVELNILMVYWAQCAIDLVSFDFSFEPNTQQYIHQETAVRLTREEAYVLSWAALGKTVAETAEHMQLKVNEVEKITASSLEKLNAANKTHAVSKALYLGLIKI